MPAKATIKPGNRFQKLVVIRFHGMTGNSQSTWECLCDCGRTRLLTTADLKKRMSCGCMRGRTRFTHHMTISPEFTTWNTMKGRCYNPNATGYERYGGRGVTVCERWRTSFNNFYVDMGPRPSSKHSLDRYPDNNGNYEPGNVRWATTKEQGRNKRSNHRLSLNGTVKSLVEWAEDLGMRADTLLARKRRGWSDHKTLTTPLR